MGLSSITQSQVLKATEFKLMSLTSPSNVIILLVIIMHSLETNVELWKLDLFWDTVRGSDASGWRQETGIRI